MIEALKPDYRLILLGDLLTRRVVCDQNYNGVSTDERILRREWGRINASARSCGVI